MDKFEQLVLAGWVHDLPALMDGNHILLTENARRVLGFSQLEDPVLEAILDQAEGYALPRGTGKDLIYDQPLVSIFSHLQLFDRGHVNKKYHQFGPLPSTDENQKVTFPVETENPSGYREQVQALANALDWLGSHFDSAEVENLKFHLAAILQRFAWCLPGHTVDASLFDHAKVTSAIAACIYRYHQDELTIDAIRENEGSERFRLIVGDLSGIQDYIFDIATIGAGGVARRLRARSLFIAMLSDVVSHQLALRFAVPLGNILMSSGGKFYVLVPNQDDAAAKLEEFRREIDRWFVSQFNGEIAVNLASVAFEGDLFRSGVKTVRGFGNVVGDLNFELNREKRRRHQIALTEDGKWDEAAFIVERDFWGVGVCISCRKFPGVHAGVCSQCERDRLVGKILPRASYLAYYQDYQPGEGTLPMPLDWSVRVMSRDDLDEPGTPYLVTKLNDPDLQDLAQLPASFRYLAKHVPTGEHGEQLSFEDIACLAEGRVLLGYLKADVDYLGMNFALGLYQDEGGYDTATHSSSLSREMDFFFSSYIQHLLSQVPDYKGFYTVFSGGDDLFLVGPWDKAADLALKIHDQFKAFSGVNPSLTISAGVLFAKERYPISRAAQDSERMLELSKEREWIDGEGKNHKRDQLTLLGDTFNWESAPQIFSEIDNLKKRLDQFKSAFLYNLVEFWELYKFAAQGKIDGYRYKPLFAYNIARNLRKDDRDLYAWADNLLQSLHGNKDDSAMIHLGLIATYLLFYKRESKEKVIVDK